MKTKKLTRLLAALNKEIKDYTKARRCEFRKRPVYLAKDSDKCVDKMRAAFEKFVSQTYS
jgi:hypothetical protein